MDGVEQLGPGLGPLSIRTGLNVNGEVLDLTLKSLGLISSIEIIFFLRKYKNNYF